MERLDSEILIVIKNQKLIEKDSKMKYTMNKILVLVLSLIAVLPISAQVSHKDTWMESGHQILSVGYSQNGNFVFTLGSDHKIIVWEKATGNIHRTVTAGPGRSDAAAFSSDDRFLISGGADQTVIVWNLALGEVFRQLDGHEGAVTCVTAGVDPSIIASGSIDRTVRIWDISMGEVLHVLEGLPDKVTSLDFHPDGDLIIAGSADGTVAIWDTNSGALIGSHQPDAEGVHAVRFSPNGNFYAVGGGESRVSIWNSYNRMLINYLFGHLEPVKTLAFSPDGRYLLTGDTNEYIVLTQMNSWKIAFHSTKQGGEIASLAFNPDGTSFISATKGSESLKVWDASSLDIESATVTASRAAERILRPKPELEWITEDRTESIGLAFRAHFRIRTDDQIDYLNTYVNNEIHSIETNPDLEPGIWNELNKVIYLEDGTNEVFIELYYADGRVVSEVLHVIYRYDVVASMLSRAGDRRRITVMLRESDRYEYIVRGAEGYYFHSDLIEAGETEKDTISVELIPLRQETSILLNDIHFATNSAELTSESFNELDKVVDLMEINPLYVVEISAHTCDLGTDAYNMLLSERRAQSVVNYLLDNEIPADRLVARGHGLRQPMVPNTSEDNRALNRRVEFKIINIREEPEILDETIGN